MRLRHRLLLFLVALSGCAVAGVSSVLQRDGRAGYVVPLSVRAGVLEAQGRRLLKHGALAPVLGAVRQGYFYAQLLLGTPPKAYATIIDTGSSITYIPCSKCQHCGTHMAKPFDPAKSSTARWLGCSDKQCECGSPSCSCRQDKCYYTRHYAEESSSEGWMVADKLHLAAEGSSGNGSNSSSSRAVEVVFGCENMETGEIYKQRVDGVLGMGNNINSLPRQLARSGVTENVFSLCYGFPQGGSMLLGDVAVAPEVKMSYTPFVPTPHNYYTIATEGIYLGGEKLVINAADFGRGYGTVLDSGTTFTYLPSSAYKAFLTALDGAIQPHNLRRATGKDPSYNDVCWVGAPKDWEGVDKIFPNGRMTFSGGAYIELVPYRYLFQADEPGQYCLGVFDNGYQGTLLGGIITRNVLVQYDKNKNRAGFAHTDCNTIKPAAQARESSEESEGAGDKQQQPAAAGGGKPGQSSGQQQQQQQSTGGTSGSSQAAEGSSAAPAAGWQHKAAAGEEATSAQQAGGSSSSRHWLFASDRKLMWLGIAVGAVVVVAIVQLAFATVWQPPPRKGGGGSSAGAGILGRGLGGDRRPYQAVGTSDEQELAELSERGLLVQQGAVQSHVQSPLPAQPQA